MKVFLTKEKILDYVKTTNELEILCKKYTDVHLGDWANYCGWSIHDNNVIINFSYEDYLLETEYDCIIMPIDVFLEKCKKL